MEHSKSVHKTDICQAHGCQQEVLAAGFCDKHYLEFVEFKRVTPVKETIKPKVMCRAYKCTRQAYLFGYCKSHIYQHGRKAETKLPAKKACKVEGCKKKNYALGLCRNHYQQEKRTEKKANRKCSIESCQGPHYRKGYCKIHYLLQTKCKAPHCKKRAKSLGYCQKHYVQLKTHGKISDILRPGRKTKAIANPEISKPITPTCIEKDCRKPAVAKGYCANHYGKLKERELMNIKCKEKGCKANATYNGYCDKHFQPQIRLRHKAKE